MQDNKFARVVLSCLVVITLLVISPLGLPAGNAKSGQSFGFISFELGRFDVPGTTCPGSGQCWNVNAEPQIRADRAGNFYAVSEFLPNVVQCSLGLDLVNPQCGGTGAWRSTDGGLHYTTIVPPNSLSVSSNNLSPYGGDTDVAVAPKRNSNGFYNVYVISLERATGPLITVELSASRDGGQTWTINPTGSPLPLNDRPWVAADSENKVCVSTHNLATTYDILVSCSYDGGLTFTQTASAFDADHLWLADLNSAMGNLAIDPNSHVIYQVFDTIDANLQEGLACLAGCSNNFHTVWVAVSIDGGKTFTDHIVYNNPDTSVGYNHQFISVAVDRGGVVYTAFSDDHNTYYSFSKDFGNTWSLPLQVNSAPASTAIFPWITAGSLGQIDVVYYGTSYYDGISTPDNYPATASWYVYFAQNLKATDTESTFSQAAATQVIHYGGVCEAGATCTGNRDLFDDFGVAASPATGRASIVYSDDQYSTSLNETPPPTCTPSLSNTGSCDHTDIATQISGPGIFNRQRGFEINELDLEQHDSSTETPEFDISVENTGSLAITSISVQLNGLVMPLVWSGGLPLLPNGTLTASTTLMPAGLLPVIGSIYPVTVTATLSDGTTVTQTAYVIYTLVVGPF